MQEVRLHRAQQVQQVGEGQEGQVQCQAGGVGQLSAKL